MKFKLLEQFFSNNLNSVRLVENDPESSDTDDTTVHIFYDDQKDTFYRPTEKGWIQITGPLEQEVRKAYIEEQEMLELEKLGKTRVRWWN